MLGSELAIEGTSVVVPEVNGTFADSFFLDGLTTTFGSGSLSLGRSGVGVNF